MAKEFKNLFEDYGFTKRDERKYPVVSRILKSLTPERIKKEIEEVQKIKLPPELQKWGKEYEKVGERREKSTWKLVYRASSMVILLSTSKKYVEDLKNNKFLASMFIILLDDIADKIQDKCLLDMLSEIPFGRDLNLDQGNRAYLEFGKKLWNYFMKNIKNSPHFHTFSDYFEYNIRHMLNGMNYCYFINKNPELINKTDYMLYLSTSICSIQILIYFTLDLMYSSFNFKKEFKDLRRIVFYAEEMTRRGNWVTTWEKELKNNDFASGIFAYGVDYNIFSGNDLKRLNTNDIVKKIKKGEIEKNLLKEWEEYYHKIEHIKGDLRGITIKKYLFALKKLLYLSLSDRHFS